jgi:hypothetical protein
MTDNIKLYIYLNYPNPLYVKLRNKYNMMYLFILLTGI